MVILYSYENIQRIHVDCDFTLAESFPIISRCKRVKHGMIWLHGADTNKNDDCDSSNNEVFFLE